MVAPMQGTTSLADCSVSSDRKENRAAHATPRLKGPYVPSVPLQWISTASKLPGGSALKVALIIWRLWVMNRRQPFVFTTKHAHEHWQLTRNEKATGLSYLSNAGLIKVVKRGRRKNPILSIIDKYNEM